MSLLDKRRFKKRKAYRDARLFVIVCEGSEKEPEYFSFFHRLSQKIKVKAIPSKGGKSSPNHLIKNAKQAIIDIVDDEGYYELWFVIDLDQWLEHNHIHNLHKEISNKDYWNMVISNPCFEVWLNNHFGSSTPDEGSECSTWKRFIHDKYGGFDSNKHPTKIEKAIKISKDDYSSNGYIPNTGCTKLYVLGEKIYELTKETLQKHYSYP